MSYFLRFKNGATTYDISDYVIKISDVAYYQRNPDYTTIADSYDIQLSDSCPYTDKIEVDLPAYFYSGSLLINNGFIEKKTYDYGKNIYKVKIKDSLRKLNEVKYLSESINQFISPLSVDITINNALHNVIKHNDIITACFQAASFSLDWTTYYTESTFSWYVQKGYYLTGRTDGAANITNDQIYYLPNAMYSINQDGVFHPDYISHLGGDLTNLEPNDAGMGKTISCFDMISILSSMTGYTYIPKDDTTFYVVSNNNTIYNIPDEKKYSYETIDYVGEQGCSISYKSLTHWVGEYNYAIWNTYPRLTRWFPNEYAQLYYHMNLAADPNGYYNGAGTDGGGGGAPDNSIFSNNNYSFGSNQKALKWYNNLVAFWIDSSIAYIIYPRLNLFSGFNPNSIAYFQSRAAVNDSVKTIIETDMQTFLSQSILPIESVIIKDTKKDIVELTWREYL